MFPIIEKYYGLLARTEVNRFAQRIASIGALYLLTNTQVKNLFALSFGEIPDGFHWFALHKNLLNSEEISFDNLFQNLYKRLQLLMIRRI